MTARFLSDIDGRVIGAHELLHYGSRQGDPAPRQYFRKPARGQLWEREAERAEQHNDGRVIYEGARIGTVERSIRTGKWHAYDLTNDWVSWGHTRGEAIRALTIAHIDLTSRLQRLAVYLGPTA